jgi:outer membrane protein assembly factor BamB
VFVGDLSGTVHAVDVRDGKRAWTFKTKGEIKSSPVVSADKVLHATPAVDDGIAYIAGCDQQFRAVRVSDGKEMFQVSSGAYTGASPALAAAHAYYGTFENDVLAVNLAARRVAWRYEDKERQFPFYSSAAVADGRVVLGGRDKRVHALEAATGKALWTFATQARVESSPAISGSIAYVGSNDGRLYALDLASGAKRWEFEAGAPLSASPAIASGRLVIGSQDGVLYCFGRQQK